MAPSIKMEGEGGGGNINVPALCQKTLENVARLEKRKRIFIKKTLRQTEKEGILLCRDC